MRFIIIIIIVFMSSSFLFAQDFEVSPLDLFFNAEPGEGQTKLINVKNHNSKNETFILNLTDYEVDSKGQGKYVDAGSLKNSIADWISITPSFFELKPNEEKQISITVQQPADEFGSKWGVIFVRTAKEQTSYTADKELSAGMSIGARIAVSIYQTPGANKSYKATIANMTENTSATDSIRHFSAIVNNIEDIITKCKVYLIATNINTLEEITFEELEFSMYPKSSRKIQLIMDKPIPAGAYSLAAILDYGSASNLEGTQLIINVE